MSKEELVNKILSACKDSVLFKEKTIFSINEILYILANWKPELGIPNLLCITIGDYVIPSLEAFVPTKIREIKFDINDVEYEEEEFSNEEFPNEEFPFGAKAACLVLHQK